MVRRGEEISRVRGGAYVVQPGVQPPATSGVERMGEAVADQPQRDGVTGDRAAVVRLRVQQGTAGPELEATLVDLDRGRVLKLEVEVRLGDVDGREAGG